MSNRRFVRAVGDPYFAFIAENIGDAATLPQFGLAQVELQFRVDRLPVQQASATELHSLLSFAHDYQTQPKLWEIAITPSGRLRMEVKSGSVWQTGEARIQAGTDWHTLVASYDGGGGQWTVELDGLTDTSVVDGSPSFILPNVGYQTRAMLFNGRDALSNMHASIRYAFMGFVGNPNNTLLTYDFSEGYGATLTPTVAGPALASSGVMRAGYYNPLFVTPYGSVPQTSTNDSYRWGLSTDYTRSIRPATTYARVPSLSTAYTRATKPTTSYTRVPS